MQLVQFSNASEAPSAVARSFTITADDGQAANNIGSTNQTLTVVAVNDTPVNNDVPATQQTAFSDTPFTISGLSVTDVDSGAGTIVTTVSALHGNINVTGAGATIGTNGTHSVTITGTLAQVQATLANNVTYQSDAGYTGQETFTILTSDNGNTGIDPGLTGGAGNEQDSDSVSIAVLPQVWFIDNTPGAVDGSAPLGSQNNPFTSIADFNASAAPGVNDYVYLRAGTYSEADGINLKDGQILVGQGENLQFANPFGGAPIVIETGSQGQTPLIIVTGNNNEGITLATNNSISGLDIGMNNATATGIEDGGATVGNLTISNVGVGVSQNLGAAVDIDQGGTLNVILESVTSSGAARAIDLGTTTGLAGAGNNFTVSGTTVINDATGDGITIANSSLNATFTGKVTILNDAGGANGDGVDLGTAAGGANTGTYNFNGGVDITVNGTGAFGLRATSSGTVGITDVGNTQIISNNGTAILINPTTFNATLDQVTSGGGSEGISLSGMSGSLSIGSVSINGQTGDGIDITNSAGSVTISGGNIGSTNDPGGIGVDINGGSGNVSIGASVTKTTDGRAIEVTDHTGTAGGGSTIAFTGAVSSTGASDGIFLDNNDGTNGATVNFTNTLTLNTSASNSNAFTATGGGTVTATGSGNSINSGSGTALNITGTTIGAADVTFQSISSNGGSATGIILDTTGALGGLHVTGLDGVDAGNDPDAGSGGTIANKTGADGATTTGNGIYLNNTFDVRLAGMQLNDFQNSAIRGFAVNGFSLQDSVISGAVGNATGPIEGAIAFGDVLAVGTAGLTGNSLIDQVNISGSIEHQIEVYNQTGTMNLTISNSSIHDGGVDGVQMELRGTAQGIVHIDNNQIFNMGSQAIQLSALEDSNLQATISRNTITRGTQGNEGIVISNGGNADARVLIGGTTPAQGNIISGFGGVAIFVGQVPGQGTAQSLLEATIQNNTVTSPSTATNHAILAFVSSLTGQVSQARLLIDSNTVNYNSAAARAILVDAPDTGRTPEFYATVTNNVVNASDVNAATMISVAARNGATGHSDIRGNDVNFTGGSTATGINVREASGGSNVLARGGSASNDSSVVLDANNPLSTTDVLPTAGDIPVVENATMLLPTTPTLPTVPLLAAAGGVASATGTSGETHLSQSQLDAAVSAAIAQWAHAGASSEQLTKLSAITFTVADLAGNAVGEHSAGHIAIDDDAAGHGWFVDTTPQDNFEFAFAENAAGTDLSAAPTSAAAGHLDLLTAVMHEMGHELGLDHAADAHALMFDSLVNGERRLPTTADVAQADGTEIFSFTNVFSAYAGDPLGSVPNDPRLYLTAHSDLHV